MLQIILRNFHVEKIVWIIKKQFKYMVLFGLLMGVLAGGVTYFTRSELYAAQISMYVYSNPEYANDNGINLSSSDLNQASNLLSSYMQIMKSNSFLESVIETAGLENQYSIGQLRNEISANAVSGASVFKVTVYDENPYNAMLIANTIGELAPQKIISIVKAGGIEILDEATLPTAPYESTSVTMVALLGIIIGIVLSAVFFLIRGLMDTRIRRLYEIEDTFTIPVIGIVPQIVDKDDKESVILSENSQFILREAYNDVRANLLFMGKGEKCPVFAVTGADYAVGKTTNSVNISRVFAMMGKKTLLIDADLRNGNVAEALKLDNGVGLSEYLANIAALQRIKTDIEGLDVITSGAYPPNPTDLLISERWSALISDMKKEYDVIIVDTPAAGIVTDAIELAGIVTAFILVVREFVSKFEREEFVVRRLEAVDANICGFIYNGIAENSEDYNHKEFVNGGKYGQRNSSGV